MDKDTIASEMARMVEDWSGRGKHWDKRADELADQSANFNMPLLEAADIQQGQMVLDCASGAGEPVLSIAKIIGPDGHVTATDLVETMMRAARRRARAQGLDNIDFQAADMVQLPFEDNHFDRVVCRLGIMFVPQPERAASEALRVLKPGGKAAYLAWGPRENTTGFSAVASAAGEVFGEDDPLFDFTSPFSLSGQGVLEQALLRGGLIDVKEWPLVFSSQVPVGKRFWAAQLDMVLGRRLDVATQSEHEALEAAILRHIEPCIVDGRYQLSVHLKIATGVKPD